MSKKEELKIEIGKVWHIYTYANECFQISYYLHKPNSEIESEYVEKSRIFKFTKHSFWRLTVIELAKIYSKSKNRDRFNLFHIISKLQENGDYRNLKMNPQILKKWDTQFKQNEDSIREVLILRDKIYSHTDPNKEKYIDSNITFEKTKKLFWIIRMVITDIYLEIFDSDPHFSKSLIGADNIKFVKVLADNKKKVRQETVRKYIEEANKNKSS